MKINKFDEKNPDATTLIDTNQHNTDKLHLKKKVVMLIKK